MVISPWTAQLLISYGWRATLQINAAIFFATSMLAALALAPCPGAPAVHPDILVGARRNKRGFAVLVIGFDLCMFGFLFPFAHLPQYAALHGVSKSSSAALLTIMGACSAVGRVLFGIFADKIGRLFAFKISVLLSALSVYFWLLCGDSFDMMAVFSAMYGVFGGSVLGLLTVAVAEVVGVVRLCVQARQAPSAVILLTASAQVGIAHSMCLVYTSISIPYLLSAPVGGWIADATGVYWPSIVLSGAAWTAIVRVLVLVCLAHNFWQPLPFFWVLSCSSACYASLKCRPLPLPKLQLK
jgi:MFS family permease